MSFYQCILRLLFRRSETKHLPTSALFVGFSFFICFYFIFFLGVKLGVGQGLEIFIGKVRVVALHIVRL